MELRQLEVFVAVAEELHFTRAGSRLGLGQQAVSKAVRQLERDLGVELLVRSPREVRLTPAGEALLHDAREVLRLADAAAARARRHGAGLVGSVRLGVTAAIGPDLRSRAAAVLRDGAPDLSVAVVEVAAGEAADALRGGRLDAVLVRTPLRGPGIQRAPLAPTPAALYVSARHRLAGRPSVSLADVDGERLLTWSPPGTPYTDELLARCRDAGASVTPVAARTTGAHALHDLAALDAVALLPARWPAGAEVEEVALPGVTLPLHLAWSGPARAAVVARLRAGLGDVVER